MGCCICPPGPERGSRAVIRCSSAAADGIGGTAYAVEDDDGALVGQGDLRKHKLVDTGSKNFFVCGDTGGARDGGRYIKIIGGDRTGKGQQRNTAIYAIPTGATYIIPTGAAYAAPTGATYATPSEAIYAIPSGAIYAATTSAIYTIPTAAIYAIPSAATCAIS